eukprot:jgi/Ulvmu1/1309/UM011_0036.1
MAQLHSRAVLLLMPVLLLLSLLAGSAGATERIHPKVFDIGAAPKRASADECCTADALECCGTTCKTRADAMSGPACPSKRACCTPPDEKPTFPDCCDLYTRCCGDRCIPLPLRHHACILRLPSCGERLLRRTGGVAVARTRIECEA